MKKVYSLPVSNIDIQSVNDGDFLILTLQAISNKVNRNNSEFLESSFIPSIPTMYNKPILAYFNPKINDVEEHNFKLLKDGNEIFSDYQYETGERPVGVIPESAEITVEPIGFKKWIVVKGAIVWSEYNYQLIKLIKQQKRKKVSVEVEVLDSYMENGIEKIRLWKFLGITILGKTPDGKVGIQEAIEGAHLRLNDMPESVVFKAYTQKLTYALNDTNKSDILSKYGLSEKNDINDVNNKKQSTKEENMHNFIAKAKENGLIFVGLNDGKLMFIKECDSIDNIEDCKLYIYAIDGETIDEEKEFAIEDFEEEEINHGEDEEKAEMQKEINDLTEKCDNLQSEKDNLQAEKDSLQEEKDNLQIEKDLIIESKINIEQEKVDIEQEKKVLEDKVESLEKQLNDLTFNQLVAETDSILQDEELGVPDEIKEELIGMRSNFKFESVDDFMKELGYKQLLFRRKNPSISKLQFSISQKKTKTNNEELSNLDKLSKI